MPIATPDVYADMLDRAKAGSFAYPAINVTSSQTLNATIRGFAEAESDGIVQVSTGGAEYLSGPTVKNMVTGSLALAGYAQHRPNLGNHEGQCPSVLLSDDVAAHLGAIDALIAAGLAPPEMRASHDLLTRLIVTLRLVAPDAQVPWDADTEARTRSILAALVGHHGRPAAARFSSSSTGCRCIGRDWCARG